MPLKLIRLARLPGVFDVGETKFTEDFRLNDPADPFIPHTDPPIKRLKLVPLGKRALAAYEHEVDELLLAFAEQKRPPEPPTNMNPGTPSRTRRKRGGVRVVRQTSPRGQSSEVKE
jgi:hypothetical protein